jgi:hypothetical protein
MNEHGPFKFCVIIFVLRPRNETSFNNHSSSYVSVAGSDEAMMMVGVERRLGVSRPSAVRLSREKGVHLQYTELADITDGASYHPWDCPLRAPDFLFFPWLWTQISYVSATRSARLNRSSATCSSRGIMSFNMRSAISRVHELDASMSGWRLCSSPRLAYSA